VIYIMLLNTCISQRQVKEDTDYHLKSLCEIIYDVQCMHIIIYEKYKKTEWQWMQGLCFTKYLIYIENSQQMSKGLTCLLPEANKKYCPEE